MREPEPTMDAITPDLLRRYDRPGPRYTSYPTAAEFHERVDNDAYAASLAKAAERPHEALALYVHLPFCEERCYYCGCNVVPTRRREAADRYLEVLQREIREVAQRLGDRRRVRQVHWGGGTPTYHTPEELGDLHAAIAESFAIEPDAELAVEVDPRVTRPEHLQTLAALGFRRLSVGIQDFTPAVQDCINRHQGFEETRDRIAEARALGFTSVNADLIYGLPKQEPDAFSRNLDQVLSLRPERVAVYSYAHMPWLKPHQRLIPQEDLPSADAKLEIFSRAVQAFCGAGYVSIGMDHFALPSDEMGRAAQDGTLWRNFMGYTVRHAPDTIAFGLSAIGDVDGVFVQNERKLGRYQHAVDDGGLAVERGYVLSQDDQIRRYIITAIMCTFRLDFDAVEARFGIDFLAMFAKEWTALRTLEQDGFVRRGDTGFEVVGLGRLFVRNVCMVFDAYLDKQQAGARPRFSRTV